MTPPLITAIICTRNRARLLDLCLRSLQRQTAPREQYEVLVIDNGSSDDTPSVCAAHASSGVRYIVEPVAGLSRARNTGWREAKAPIVGYLDDDAQALEGWMAGALAVFQNVHPAPAWAGGPIDLDWQSPPPEWLDASLQGCLGILNLGDSPRWMSSQEQLVGCNSVFPRALLEEMGGFDERLGRVNNLLLSGEETQLQKRIEARGGRLYYHPDIRIRHHVPLERMQPGFFYRRYYWGGITDVLMQRTLRDHLPDASDAAHPAAAAPAGSQRNAQLGRLLRNLFAAAGCARPANRIHGRIYMSYVCGALRGRLMRTTPAPAS